MSDIMTLGSLMANDIIAQDREITSLRGLVAEMREAMTVLITTRELNAEDAAKICAATDKADAFLSGKQEEKAVRFGCHIDTPFGEQPYPTCFAGTDREADCELAVKLKSKEPT